MGFFLVLSSEGTSHVAITYVKQSVIWVAGNQTIQDGMVFVAFGVLNLGTAHSVVEGYLSL